MRTKITFFILCAGIVFLAACNHKDSFIISGEVENPKKIQKIYLLAADSSANNAYKASIVDSVVLNDQHKFSFKHFSNYPNLYRLKVGEAMFDFAAENGDDITFKTDMADTTNAYTLSGSKDSEKIMEFNKLANYYSGITQKILVDYNYKTKVLGMPRDSLFNKAVVAYRQNSKISGIAIMKFAMENKGTMAGFYAATSIDPIVNEKALIEYNDQIKGQFAGNQMVAQFSKRMDTAKPVSIGHKAPDFALMDKDYKLTKVSDYRGKYLVVDFWASWCAPCRQENPNVVKMYNKFKSKGLDILGVSLDDNRIDWQNAIASDKLPWKQVAEFKNFNGPVVKLYQIQQIPANYILDPEGNIIAKNLLGKDLEDFLNKIFSKSEDNVKPM